MSWVGDIVRCFNYKCPDGHLEVLTMKSSEHGELKPKPEWCEECGQPLSYAGFSNVPASAGGMPMKPPARLTYEQNGRKAVKVGNTYMSQTKWDYLETGKVENKYTPAFQEKLNKEKAAGARRDAAQVAKKI